MKKIDPSEHELDPINLLKWYVSCGVDETTAVSPTNWFDLPKDNHTEQDVKKTLLPVTSPVPQTLLSSHKQNIEAAVGVATKAANLEELREAIISFEGCSLKNTASNTVFSDGNVDSDILLISEAPGAEEDQLGKPFVSSAGQLLDKMFGAINMTREQNFYIINLLPWRPPGNRKPTVAECEVCLPFVKRHIELFKPKLIILIGGTSANSIMNVKTGITKLRGKWSKFKLDDQMIPMITIFHPSYLLRQPQFKKLAWQDLLSIKEHLESQKSD